MSWWSWRNTSEQQFFICHACISWFFTRFWFHVVRSDINGIARCINHSTATINNRCSSTNISLWANKSGSVIQCNLSSSFTFNCTASVEIYIFGTSKLLQILICCSVRRLLEISPLFVSLKNVTDTRSTQLSFEFQYSSPSMMTWLYTINRWIHYGLQIHHLLGNIRHSVSVINCV